MHDPLRQALTRLTEAMRHHGAALGAGWGALTTLSGVLAATLVARTMPLWYKADLLLVLIWALGSGVLIGALCGYAWPRPLPRRLRVLDRRLALSERLTTTWELEQGDINTSDTMKQLQREETLRALHGVDPRSAFPLHPPRAITITTSVLMLLLIPALLLPNPQETELARRAAQQQAAEDTVEQLETVRDTLTQDSTLTDAEREAALRALEQALRVLKDHSSTPEEQQAALTEAEQQLARLRSPEAEAQAQRLAEAAPLSTEAIVQPLTEALQQGDLEAAAAYLRNLIEPGNGEPLTAEEVRALADTFTQIADALQSTDASLAEQFRDIAQEIYQGDANGAREALQQAANAMSDVAQANAPNQALEQAQAGVQQAQERLGASQQQTMAQTPSDSASGQQGASGTQGQAGGNSGAPSGNTTGGGTGSSGHHEDAGSSAPYGQNEAGRISGQGGEITLPRPETEGLPQTTTGLPGPARTAYQEVYGEYVEAAEAALSRQAYPPALRAYVREYFSGLGE